MKMEKINKKEMEEKALIERVQNVKFIENLISDLFQRVESGERKFSFIEQKLIKYFFDKKLVITQFIGGNINSNFCDIAISVVDFIEQNKISNDEEAWNCIESWLESEKSEIIDIKPKRILSQTITFLEKAKKALGEELVNQFLKIKTSKDKKELFWINKEIIINAIKETSQYSVARVLKFSELPKLLWNEGLSQPKGKVSKVIPEEDKVEIVRLAVEEKKSLKEITKKFGISRDHVQKVLTQNFSRNWSGKIKESIRKEKIGKLEEILGQELLQEFKKLGNNSAKKIELFKEKINEKMAKEILFETGTGYIGDVLDTRSSTVGNIISRLYPGVWREYIEKKQTKNN